MLVVALLIAATAGSVLIREQANTQFSSCFMYVGQGNDCHDVAFSFIEISSMRRIDHIGLASEASKTKCVMTKSYGMFIEYRLLIR